MATFDGHDDPAPLPRPPGETHWRDTVADWWDDIVDRVHDIGPSRRIIVAAVGALIAGAALAIWLSRSPEVPPPEAALPMIEPEQFAPTPAPVRILVHVAGAVEVPGVYAFDTAVRAVDAIEAAGGPSVGADLDRLNLAAALGDGDRLFVPLEGEDDPAPGPGAAGSGNGGTGLVDVNKASADELDVLPGVGPATALSIVRHREEHGPFATVDDLLDVPGIGPAKLAQLRDLVSTS